jgi:hypothetical protein
MTSIAGHEHITVAKSNYLSTIALSALDPESSRTLMVFFLDF